METHIKYIKVNLFFVKKKELVPAKGTENTALFLSRTDRFIVERCT